MPGGPLNLNSTNVPRLWSPRESSPSGKIPTVEPGIGLGTSLLVVRDSDHYTTKMVLFKICKSGNGKLTELFSYTDCRVKLPLLFPARQARKTQLNNFSINRALSSVTTHNYFPGYMNTTPCIISLNKVKCLLSYCTAVLCYRF